jgi:signal transduction histidine kinase
VELRNQPPGPAPADNEGHPGSRTGGTAVAAWRALAALRLVGFAWAVVAVLASFDDLTRPVVAVGLLAVAAVITAAPIPVAVAGGQAPPDAWLVAELLTGFALAAATGFVYDHGGAGPSSIATLGVMWPLVGVLAAGVRWGDLAGAAAGAWFGAGRLVGAVAGSDGWPEAAQSFSVASTAVVSMVAGVLAAATVRWAGTFEARAAEAAARERMARDVHDGVLQTLAAIEARSPDPVAVQLARAESRRVRQHLFGRSSDGASASLDDAVRDALGRVEDRFGVRCELAVVEPVGLAPDTVDRLAGAVGEAATNAAKHGGVGCTLLVLPDGDGVTVTIHDEGPGFDPDATPKGAGLRSSVVDRIGEIGGTVEVASAPGRGCEVRLWVPFASS